MSISPIIEAEHLQAKIGNKIILKDVSFKMFPGQISVILGTSGSGKTTVLKHLIGLYPVQKGSVRVMNREVQKLSEREKKALFLKTGVLFQNGALLNSLTVGENIAIPLELHTRLPRLMIRYLVSVKLGLVNLPGAEHLMPSQLSGGMLKRAALARAIVLDPPVLFCDEPSAGLDPVTLFALDKLILNLKEQLGMTIVLVTHEVASIRRLADRIFYLDEGTIVFEGTLEEGLKSELPQLKHFFSRETVS